MDITERKQAEEQLHFQAHILKSIEQAIIVTTPAGIVTYVNQFAETMYGWAATDALGKNIMELIVPQISSAQAQETMSSLRDGKNWQGEFMAQRKDGSLIVVQVVNTPIMDEHGNITAIAGISSDITKRKQIDDNLVHVSRTLQEAQEIAHLGSFEYVLATQATIWSEEEYHIYGLDPKEPSPDYKVMLEKCIHPDDAKLLDDTFMAAVKTQTTYELENRIVRPDGSIRWVCSKANPYFDKHGNLLRYVGTTLDITERKHTEEKIKRDNQLLEASQAIAKVGGWELDLTTGQLYWTAETYRIHDTSPEEFNPTVDAGVGYFLPESKRQISEALELAMTKGIGYDLYLETYTTKGRKINVRTTCEVTLVNGKPIKLTGIFQDITEIKKAESKTQASEARFKNSFAASPIPFALNDVDGNITDLNAAFIDTFGYTSSDIPTLNDWWPRAYPDIEYRHWVAREWEKRLDTMLQNGSAFEPLEINICCKDGTTRVVIGSAAFLENSLQGLHQVILFDITERKTAEKKISLLQQKYLAILNAANGIVWEADAQTFQFSFVSGQAEAILGYPINRWMEEPTFWKDHIYPDDRTWVVDYCLSYTRKNQAHDFEYRMIAADGRIVWLHDIVSVESENGIPVLLRGLMVDITERKNAETELENTHKRLELATHAAKIGIWEFFIDDQKLIWDDKMFDLFKVSKSTFSGTYEAWRSAVHPDDLERSEQELQKAIASGQSFNSEFRIVWQDKSIHHIKGMAESVRDTNGKSYKMIGINYDITEQKEAQNEIERSNARLSLATQSAHIGIWEFLVEEDILIWEDETLKLFGLTRDSFSGNYEGWRSTVHPEDVDEAEQKIREAIANKTILNIEFRTIWPDKTIRYIGAFGKTVLDDTGKVIKLVGTNYDVTERVQKEKELVQAKEKAEENQTKLKASERRLLAIIDTEPECVKLVAPNGRLLEMNTAGLNMLEASSVEEINQHGLMEFILASYQESFRQLHKSVIEGESGTLQFEVVGLKGTKRWLESHAKPLILENDSVPVLLAVTRDVTIRVQMEQELKKQNKELIKAKEKAEESDRLKTAFLANMSHEIRTPMNGILGFANLLQKQGITHQKETEYLALIQQSGTRMLNIINDIISISKIESDEIPITLSPTNINEKLEFIRAFFEPEASTKGIQIIVTGALPANKTVVITDPEKVYGTLTNLVKNAIKFTHAGTIELGCHEKPEQAELEFFVKDKGIGIAHDQLDFIFERFRQVNESSTRNYEGAGLGLAISKAQVEKLGGKMWVESEVGKGSTFYFTIPCQRDLPGTQLQAAEPGSSKNKEQSHKGIKIVLAEDDFISAAFLKAVLNINGNEILHATTGTEAVEIVRNNPDTDVVLMDVGMPELNGYEATSQIRQFNKTVVIIVQSGYTFEENVKQAAEVGCTDYIAKPVDENELLRMIEKHVRK